MVGVDSPEKHVAIFQDDIELGYAGLTKDAFMKRAVLRPEVVSFITDTVLI